MQAVAWGVLGAGIVALIGAVIAAVQAHRAPVDADAAPAETGLIQPLPASAPPPGGRPGMFGILDDGEVNAHELALTLLDLATRGFVVLSPVLDTDAAPPRVSDWTLTRTPVPADGLHAYESALLDTLPLPAPGLLPLSLSAWASARRAALERALTQLRGTARATGWTTAPRRRNTWGAVGGILLLAGLVIIAASLVGAMAKGLPWPSVTGGGLLVVSGVILASRVRLRPGRTTDGDAALRQVRRYRAWLDNLAAHEIRVEEAGDVLTTHLAAAITFGSAGHLAEALDQLVRRAAGWARTVPIETPWLGPDHPVWTDAPLPGQIVALAQQFVAAGERAAEQAGVGVVAPSTSGRAATRRTPSRRIQTAPPAP